jgi:hypothetical protein
MFSIYQLSLGLLLPFLIPSGKVISFQIEAEAAK